ncbi:MULTISPECIES: ABC transporter ATP-binding protein [Frankiaceae]|uniref:Taurine-transporting ATPase n=1 Tax=Candidatus Protofrankia datiscae TaxID=2716812 RepID=F8AVB9_9ACTN|nr:MULTISPECIES: ABC transporter ATP-binding protein [Protofrankia]AEH08211.1 Taurine-transporting ATPase [Candidatus Protofrankia datiscae]
MSTIEFRNVTKRFAVRNHGNRRNAVSEFTAVDDVNLRIRSGEFLALVGPSGCGKSTLLDILGGLTGVSEGQVLVDDNPVSGPGLDRGIVFQQYALFPWRTALGNVEFGLEAKKVARSQRSALARHYLDLVGLSGFEHRYPHELSGGMKQRVAIARSLAYDPAVLLLDEPFAALDAQTRETLQDELLRIWAKTGKTILFVTHGIDEAVYLGQRVAVMTSRPGRIKQIVDIPITTRADGNDLRSDPEFVRYRHEVWELLREEVARAQQTERDEQAAGERASFDGGPARRGAAGAAPAQAAGHEEHTGTAGRAGQAAAAGQAEREVTSVGHR